MRLRPTALMAVFLIGCLAESNPVVLTVGNTEVRGDEFRHLFLLAARRDSTLMGDAAGRLKFAETLAEDLLYEQVFLETEQELEESREGRLMDYKETRMVEYLREIEYADARTVTPKELEDAYAKLGRRLHVRRVLIESEPKALEIRRAVREGALFDRVAMQASLDDRTRALGGDLGWVVYTDLPALERDPVFELAPGEVSAPIPAGRIFSLYQVVEADENHSRGTLEEEREALSQGILQRKLARAIERYREGLFERSGFRIDPAQLAWMTLHMREKTQGTVRGTDVLQDPSTEEREGYVLSRGRIPWTGPPVAPADTGRVVATFAPDGEVTPVLIFDHLLSKPTPTWPLFDKSADVEELIRELVLERLEQAEAYRRGYDTAPEVLFDVRAREREIRRRQVTRNQLRNPSIPAEEEIRAEYERRIDEFRVPEQRRFLAINLSTWKAAARAAELLRQGRSAAEVAAQFGPEDNLVSTGDQGTPLLARGQSPALDEVLFSLEIGQVSDPIAVGETYTVARVLEIVPATVKPFEEVRVDLQIDMVDRRIEPLAKRMLDEARQRHPVEIDVAALQELELR